MERPVFVVLRKAFHILHGFHVAYCPDGGDVELFFSYEKAFKSAENWCHAQARDVEVFMNLGELSRASAQYSDICAEIIGKRCFDSGTERVCVEIFQKYVL